MKSKNLEIIEDEIDLMELFKTIWSQKWLIVKITSTFVVLSIIYALSLDNIYKASVTMLPQSQESERSKFSGLAALAGINMESSATSNEAFYEDVLVSDKLLDNLISKKWVIGEKKQFLHEFLEIKLSESHFNPKAKLAYDLKQYLRDKAISFSSSKENGLMTLSVAMPLEPKLSANIANWLASELHEYNEKFRQKKSMENLSTVKIQLDQAKSELIKAENKLSDFQKSNKNYTQSAELQLEYARLTREVITENTVYTELRKQFEIAKIDLAKSKETITILDKATIPVLKDSPKRGLICILGLFLGFFIAIFWVFVRKTLFERK
jgi:uncharacterized protein involved in exopolysaccharide biosynthesis